MFSAPVNYPAPESMSVPTTLIGEEMKTFRNCKSVIKSIPASSGSNVGPSSTMLFQIPTGGLDFLKSGSAAIRMKVSVTLVGGAAVSWKFSSSSTSDAYDWGSAVSLLDRINVSFGGVTQSYSNYAHYFNSVLTHALNPSYFYNDLKQLCYAGQTKLATTDTQVCKDVYVTIPLIGVGAFNSQTALPLCLMSSPIQLEIQTQTVNKAFSGATTGITNYSISEASLIYESIQVEPSFVQALKASKQGQTFNLRVNDYLSVGPFSPAISERYQLGCGLQSLKAILFTEQLQSCNATALAEKNFSSNGLSSLNFYIDGQQVSLVNQTDDAAAFAEMNRALQRLTDSNIVSCLEPTTNVSGTGLRTTYCSHNFLAGASTMNISDWGYSMVGQPASVVSVELNHSAVSDQAVRWQSSTAYSSAVDGYIFLLYDALYSVDITTGVVSIRK
jgi:hypothetical protein